MSGIHPMRLRADDVVQTNKERGEEQGKLLENGMAMTTGNRDEVTHEGTMRGQTGKTRKEGGLCIAYTMYVCVVLCMWRVLVRGCQGEGE